MTTTLTSERITRVKQEILHTQDQLNKELGYMVHLQDVSQISFYRKHISKLQNMIK